MNWCIKYNRTVTPTLTRIYFNIDVFLNLKKIKNNVLYVLYVKLLIYDVDDDFYLFISFFNESKNQSETFRYLKDICDVLFSVVDQ